MPSFTKDGTAAAGRTRKLIHRPVEHSVLHTLTILDLTDLTRPNQAYAEIGLMFGGITPEQRIAILATGYVGLAQSVSWHGYIILEAEMSAYAHIYSTPGGRYRLAGLLTPYIVSAEGGILLDP